MSVGCGGVPLSPSEIIAHLIEPPLQHGVGNWKAILDDPALTFAEDRTPVDLKDRYAISNKMHTTYLYFPFQIAHFDSVIGSGRIFLSLIGNYTLMPRHIFLLAAPGRSCQTRTIYLKRIVAKSVGHSLQRKMRLCERDSKGYAFAVHVCLILTVPVAWNGLGIDR